MANMSLLHHYHNPGLVLLSIIIAILASYTALDLAGRVTAARGRARLGWLLGGAVAMGIGIWSMHFTAMLAFSLPIPIFYHVPIVFLSLAVAIIASGIALQVASRQEMNWGLLLVGGVIMGVAIAAMHYVGMAAVRLQADLTYDPVFFTLSVIIAITASIAALWLAFQFRTSASATWNWWKIGSAVVMGAAISGMHYTGMRAAIFTPNDALAVDLSMAVDISLIGALSIAIGTFMVLGLALLLSLVDQRLATQAFYLIESETRHNAALQELNDELKDRVSDLELATRISQAMAAILDQKRLFTEIVEQIRITFDYYHVHLYLFEPPFTELQVVSGTGQVGRTLVANGHKIPFGKGLVGRAAKTKQIVLVPDVSQHPDWLPNSLLPETKAEIAVPIVQADQVLGVLDVQNDRVGSLGQRDANILQLIAHQVAVTLQNARLFAEAEAALGEARSAQERYVAQAWGRETTISQENYYHHTRPNTPPLAEALLLEAKHQASDHEQPAIVDLKVNDVWTEAIVTSLVLHNKRIGSIQLHTTQPDHAWAENDIAIVEAVVNQFVQTAENLRLFEETRQSADYERLVREITRKIREAPNLEALSKIAAETLSDVLGVSDGVVQLGVGRQQPQGEGVNGHDR